MSKAITSQGFIKGGKLYIADRDNMSEQVKQRRDCDVIVSIEEDNGKGTKRQSGYYWSTLVPHTLIILRDLCGYSEYKTIMDAHEFLKYRHNPQYKPNPENPEEPIRFGGTTTTMSKERKIQYIDDIIMDSWNTWQYTMPPPKRNQDKYYFSN